MVLASVANLDETASATEPEGGRGRRSEVETVIEVVDEEARPPFSEILSLSSSPSARKAKGPKQEEQREEEDLTSPTSSNPNPSSYYCRRKGSYGCINKKNDERKQERESKRKQERESRWRSDRQPIMIDVFGCVKGDNNNDNNNVNNEIC